ncbi:hypothetical protein ACQJBY_032711 [Aegilops geniculata]
MKMQQKARFTSSSSGCFSVHLLPVVQMLRAGKFYYQSTPSSGALPLMERTMNQRRRIIGRRRPGQGTMTGAPWPITATTAGRSTPPPQAVHRKNSDLDPAGSHQQRPFEHVVTLLLQRGAATALGGGRDGGW